MTKKQIKIGLVSGLEARPIAMMVQIANEFESSIYVDIGSKRVNAKSIMGMMTLAMDAGDEITISADGPDEETAMVEIEKYLRSDN